jgi:HEPN domain-containing protein
MMTKEQHINHWVKSAQRDWVAAENAYNVKDYLHSLFWAHLTIEKLAKAHWVKNNPDNYPPRIHNIVSLLQRSNIDLGNEMMIFLEEFNDFQLSGRYQDYLDEIYMSCTEDFTREQLDKVEEVRQCLIKML